MKNEGEAAQLKRRKAEGHDRIEKGRKVGGEENFYPQPRQVNRGMMM
jgi:hypothetical protein